MWAEVSSGRSEVSLGISATRRDSGLSETVAVTRGMPSVGVAAKAAARTVISFLASVDWTVSMALPA